MARQKSLENISSFVVPQQAPDWDSARYLNFAGRTVKHSDIVNMTNMDVARNSTMLSFAKIAGPIARYIPIPAVKAIGYAATAASYGYDSLKLFQRMNENKSNDAFWSEYNEAVKGVQAQSDSQRIATDFAIGSNLASGQSLPSNVKPIGEIAGGLGQMAQYVALGVLGGTKTFIFGGAISNAANEANTRMGYGEEQGAAIKAGIARGIASGVTASAFLAVMPAAITRLGGHMIDKEIGLGFWSHPATNFAIRGSEFAGWGAVDPYAVNTARSVMGLEPEPNEFDPGMTAGMFALGGMLSGGLLKKSYSFTGPRRMPSTGEKEYMNFAEMAAAKKSALKAVNETVGVRYFGDVTTPERQHALMETVAGRKLPMGGKEVKPTPDIESPVQTRLMQAETGERPYGKPVGMSVEQIILKSHGVSDKLTTPKALEKVGGPEAALRLSTNDEEVIARAMSELSTANRLIKQSQEYDLSAQVFTTERTGGKVTDTFIPDAEGVARKVRVVESKEPKGGNAKDIVVAMIDAGNRSMQELRKDVSAVRYSKDMGYLEFEFQGKTQKVKEPMDVMPVGDSEASKAWALRQILDNGVSKNVPTHIKKAVKKGSAAIVSGLIYTNLGNDQWNITETQWLTPAVASRLAEMARNEYRISRDRQGSITKAMNVLTDDYALNPDNYKMVYDRFMKLTGGYA